MHQLTAAVVEDVIGDADDEIRERRVRSLGTHQRLLLRIITEAGDIDSGTLHARYEDRSPSLKSLSSRRRYLKSLRQYDFMEANGTGTGTRYQSRA